MNYLVVPGVGIYEFFTTNQGISVIFDLTFLPGGRKFVSKFWENVKIPPYAPPPPRRFDIDRCITRRPLFTPARSFREVSSNFYLPAKVAVLVP